MIKLCFKKTTNRFEVITYYWLPVILYCALIFIQSSYKTQATLPQIPHIDKLIHMAIYAILSALFLRAFNRSKLNTTPNLVIWISIICSSLYGISDEIHQYFIPEFSGKPEKEVVDLVVVLHVVLEIHSPPLALSRNPENELLVLNKILYIGVPALLVTLPHSKS